MSENIFMVSSLFDWFLAGGLTLLYFSKGKNNQFYVRKILAINSVFFLVISIVWFYRIAINDGISQVMGVFIYLGIGIILSTLQVMVLKVKKNKTSIN